MRYEIILPVSVIAVGEGPGPVAKCLCLEHIVMLSNTDAPSNNNKYTRGGTKVIGSTKNIYSRSRHKMSIFKILMFH